MGTLQKIYTMFAGFVASFSHLFSSKGTTDGSKNTFTPPRRRMTLQELREMQKGRHKRFKTKKQVKARAKAKRAKKARKVNYRAAKLHKLSKIAA